MDTKTPTITRVAKVEPGQLFVLYGGRNGNPLCLKAAYTLPPEEADEANRVIPLHWPEDESSVGVAIYATALSGGAVVLEGARLEVNPLSARQLQAASPKVVYGRDNELFLPLIDNGRVSGLVNAMTGEILPHMSGDYVAFDDWSITIPGDGDERLHVFPLEEDE